MNFGNQRVKPACRLFAIFACALSLLTGCVSTENVSRGNTDIDFKGIKIPSRFFVLKKSGGEYINNITFKRYSTLFADRLGTGGWEQASYADAETFLFLEYGVGAFYDGTTTVKPEYDRKTNRTTWVHTDARIRRMPFLRITGVRAAVYRERGEETVVFTLLVTHPGSAQAEERLMERMLLAGADALL